MVHFGYDLFRIFRALVFVSVFPVIQILFGNRQRSLKIVSDALGKLFAS